MKAQQLANRPAIRLEQILVLARLLTNPTKCHRAEKQNQPLLGDKMLPIDFGGGKVALVQPPQHRFAAVSCKAAYLVYRQQQARIRLQFALVKACTLALDARWHFLRG